MGAVIEAASGEREARDAALEDEAALECGDRAERQLLVVAEVHRICRAGAEAGAQGDSDALPRPDEDGAPRLPRDAPGRAPLGRAAIARAVGGEALGVERSAPHGDPAHGAAVEDVVLEEVGAQAAAQHQPAERAKLGVEVEREVGDAITEAVIGEVGDVRRGAQPLLGAVYGVVASVRAELHGLHPALPGGAQAGGGAHADIDRGGGLVDEVAALRVRGLIRLLYVQERAGEVLSQAKVAQRGPRLGAKHRRLAGALEIGGHEVPRDLAALGGVVRVVEADAPGAVVVLANHPSGAVPNRVGHREHAPGERPGVTLVLGVGGGALVAAVLSVAFAAGEFDAAEGARALAIRTPERQHPVGVERPAAILDVRPARWETEGVLGRSRDSKIALARIEGAFQNAQRLDQLGDEEVRVGVALAVRVRGLVDGDAVDGELQVLPAASVEAAKKDLIRVALAEPVGDEHPGRESQ